MVPAVSIEGAEFHSESVFLICVLEVDVLVPHQEETNCKVSHRHVVKGIVLVIIDGNPKVAIETIEVQIRNGIQRTLKDKGILIEHISESKTPAMPKEQSSQVLELGHSYIRVAGGLVTFLAKQADSNVSFLNHANIISSISNGQSNSFLNLPPNKLD